MRTITFDKEIYYAPGEWNEFTAEQLIFLSLLVSKECTAQEVKLKLLLFCLSARIRRYMAAHGEHFNIKIGKKSYFLTAAQLTGLCEVFDFLFVETTKGSVTLNIKLTRNPFRKIQSGKIILFGPDDGLTDISYGQFIMLQAYQQQMAVDWNYIDQFLSVIYKENGFTTKAEGNPEFMKAIQPDIKTVLFWFYLGSVNFIVEKFMKVFSSDGIIQSDVFDNQMRIVDALANGDVTKKEQVKESLLYDALYTMEIGAEKENTREKF